MEPTALIAYAWIATVIVVIALAASKGKPILHAFAPLPNWWLSAVALGVAVAFAAVHLQAAAMLVMLGYAWVCVWWALR